MFQFLKRKKTDTQANLSSPDEWLVDALLGGMSSAGVNVTPVAALGVSTVYACVSVISKAIASLPLSIYSITPAGDRIPAVDHPLHDTLSLNPARNMTTSEVMGALVANLVLRGNAYALLSRDGLGNVRQMVPIEPSDINLQVHPQTNELDYVVNGKKVALTP